LENDRGGKEASSIKQKQRGGGGLLKRKLFERRNIWVVTGTSERGSWMGGELIKGKGKEEKSTELSLASMRLKKMKGIDEGRVLSKICIEREDGANDRKVSYVKGEN